MKLNFLSSSLTFCLLQFVFLPCSLLYHSKICKGITSFWRSPQMHHRGKYWGNAEGRPMEQTWSKTEHCFFLQLRVNWSGRREGRVIHRLSVSQSTFWKKKFSFHLLGYSFKDLILEWAYLHIYIHSTAQFCPLHLKEKVPLSLKWTCGNPGPRRITQKTQCQE